MVCTIKEKSKRTQLWTLCMKFRTHLRDEITVYWLKKKKKKKTIKSTYHHPVDSNTSSSRRQPHLLSRNRCTSLSLSPNSKDKALHSHSQSLNPCHWRKNHQRLHTLVHFPMTDVSDMYPWTDSLNLRSSSSSSRFRKHFSGKKSLTDPVDSWDMFFVFKPP